MPKTNGNITTADKSNKKPLTKSQVNGYLNGSSEDEKNITKLRLTMKHITCFIIFRSLPRKTCTQHSPGLTDLSEH